MPRETPAQDETLRFIYDYQQEHGFSPGYRQISEHRGRTALRTAGDILYKLQDRGLVELRGARAIKITPKGHEALSVPTNTLMEIALAASALMRGEATHATQ